MSSASFSSQPLETINRICSFLDKPKDLLSLALTAKVMCQVIIPSHIEFRIIRCDIRRKHLWEKLSKLTGMASQIMGLDLISEQYEVDAHPTASKGVRIPRMLELGGPGIPQDVPTDWPYRSQEHHHTEVVEFEATCTNALVQLIHSLNSLACFHWDDYTTICTAQIFAALRDFSPKLCDVEILIDGQFLGVSARDIGISRSPLWEIKNLRRFSFTFMHVDLQQAAASEYVDRMTVMLVDHCPNLEELLLRVGTHGTPNNISQLIHKAHWPRLKILSLAGQVTEDNDDTLNSFFSNHPQLECLQLCEGITRSPIMRLSNLPNLKSLHLGWGVACRDISEEVTKNLEYIGLFLESGQGSQLGTLLSKMSELRHFELVGVPTPVSLESLEPMVEACPRLERLALHAGHLDMEKDALADYRTLRRFLAGFSRLTHLSLRGMEFSFPYVHGTLALTLPTLRYIEMGIDDYVWHTIERDEDGTFSGFHTTEHIPGLDIDEWRELYKCAQN